MYKQHARGKYSWKKCILTGYAQPIKSAIDPINGQTRAQEWHLGRSSLSKEIKRLTVTGILATYRNYQRTTAKH